MAESKNSKTSATEQSNAFVVGCFDEEGKLIGYARDISSSSQSARFDTTNINEAEPILSRTEARLLMGVSQKDDPDREYKILSVKVSIEIIE